MGKLIGFLLRELTGFLLLVLLAPLIFSLVYEALFFISNVSFYLMNWFIFGFLFYILMCIFVSRRRVAFLEHFEHELGHAMVALVFFRDIRQFLVNPEEGSEVRYQDGSNILIRLAPYYLPVFAIPLAAIRPFVFPPIHIIINCLMGFTLAIHYVSLLKRFRWGQPDIKKTGLACSFCVACPINAILLIMILCIVSGNYLGILSYFESSIARTPESYQSALQTLLILNGQLLQQ